LEKKKLEKNHSIKEAISDWYLEEKSIIIIV